MERERGLRQAGAWRSLLAPYYAGTPQVAAYASLTPDEAFATAAVGEQGPTREVPWSVLERRLAEAQQAIRS